MAFIPPTPLPLNPPLRPSAFISTLPPICPSRRPCACRIRHLPPATSTSWRHGAPRMSAVEVKTVDVFMPALSSTMSEGRIVQWLKQPGDPVVIGEPLMVVESDKADMDVESFATGFLAAILVPEGDTCDVGHTVGLIVDSKDDIPKLQQRAPSYAASLAPVSSDDQLVADPAPPVVAVPSHAPSGGGGGGTSKPEMTEIFMPALSSTMTEGKVVEWLKSEGDAVRSGEMVMVVESDKADMDVESFQDGFIAHILIEAGASAPVGEPVAYVAESQADIAAVKEWVVAQGRSGGEVHESDVVSGSGPAPAPPSARPSADLQARTPSVGGEGVIVNEGRVVASPRAKVVAKEAGVDLRMVKGTGPEGRIVEADVVKAKESGVGEEGGKVESGVLRTGGGVPEGKVIATPEAKKIAKTEKIDIHSVNGTGNFGRVTADDVLKAAGKAPMSTPAPVAAHVEEKKVLRENSVVEKPAVSAVVPEGAVTMNAMQKAVVQNMTVSLTVPVFRVTYKIKTKALDELYAKVKPKGVTMSAMIAKAVAIALTQNPIMNAQYAENAIVYRPDVHVAMAVSLKDGGLITPTLKNADKTDLYSMSRDWKDLVKRALGKKLAPDEYNSGTFFVSNMGMFGVDQFDAILPPGAPGILAIGASQPVVGLQENGLVGVQKEMKVTLTADHRHIYGADGAKFLQSLAAVMEDDVTALLM